MYVSCEQNAGHSHNIKIADKPFENMANFRYAKPLFYTLVMFLKKGA
jgi:hypothetical protein